MPRKLYIVSYISDSLYVTAWLSLPIFAKKDASKNVRAKQYRVVQGLPSYLNHTGTVYIESLSE